MYKVLIGSTALALILNLVQILHDTAPASASIHSGPSVRAARAVVQASPSAPKTSNIPVQSPAVERPVTATERTLSSRGMNPGYAGLYLQVQAATGTPWQLLAAVHWAETRQSGDTQRASYAGAVGPMQFMPATFKAYARDGDGDGLRRIGDVDDAVMSAGAYLASNGAAKTPGIALYRYNHSNAYVSNTLAIAKRLGL